MSRPDPLKVPVVRYEFQLADGAVLVREWSLSDGPPRPPSGPPDFLTNARRRWTHPQDPVTLLGDVLPGRKTEARAWLDAQGGDG